MRVLPSINETSILEEDCSCIVDNLLHNTRQKGDGIPEGNRLFRGQIGEDSFKISLDIRDNVNFLPLISGKVEKTSDGCLLFLNYQLFWGTVVIVGFWTVLSIFFSLFFYWVQNEIIYAVIAIGFGIVNYIVTLFSFNRMVKRSRRILNDMLGVEG